MITPDVKETACRALQLAICVYELEWRKAEIRWDKDHMGHLQGQLDDMNAALQALQS